MAASLQGIIEISPPECRVRDIASASSFEYVCRSSVLVEYVHMEKAVGISTGMGCKLESVCVARDGRCAKLDVDRNEDETVGPRGDNERISFAQGESDTCRLSSALEIMPEAGDCIGECV